MHLIDERLILSFCENQPNILFQLCSYFFLYLKMIHISFQNGNDMIEITTFMLPRAIIASINLINNFLL